MKDHRLLDDDDLATAFRSVRDAYDGSSNEANTTLHRALFHTRTHARRQRLTRWVVLPIAAVLAASTAWAGVTGKLTPAVHSVLESLYPERSEPAKPPPSVPAQAARTASTESPPLPATDPSASTETPPLPATDPSAMATAITPLPMPEAPSMPSKARAVPSGSPASEPLPSSTSVPSGSSWRGGPSGTVAAQAAPSLPKETTAPRAAPSAGDPHAALFAEAHRIHFTERDPARALAAWDRYLAVAPNGRFSPEARYNRALALVRLGREAEAQRELEPFASGTYGGYRREEAKALLDALARDASRP